LVELRRKLPEPTFGFPKPALDDAKRDIGEIATVVELEYELPVLGDERTTGCRRTSLSPELWPS
jgi:hypothetical protein